MKKICFLVAIAMSFFSHALYSQNCPPNIDFESGDFSNWECFTGTTEAKNGINLITLLPSAPIPGRHDIITETFPAAMDRFGNFPKLCPYGGKYSVKLGNEGTGAQAEGLSYTFQVPMGVDSFSFTYFYAVVFQDPKHNPSDQPRFFVTAYDVVSGALINCASYNYISTGSIPGFRVSSVQKDVLYKSWSPVSIQFAGLAGRKVRLEFKTADCTQGGHFGYAYVDVGAGCSNVLATAPYCVETNSLVLNAPYGFQHYTWYNSDYTAILGNQQTLTLSPPPATSGVFHVDIVPYPEYGCRDTADAVIHPLPVPEPPVAPSNYTYCQFASVPALTATSLMAHDLLWYTSATGGIGNSNAPTPSTLIAGEFDFYVAQKVLFGCESFRTKITVTINPTPSTSFITNNTTQCLKGNSFKLISTSTNLNNSAYTWNFGDGQTASSSDSTTTHTYARYGKYTISLKVLNPPVCYTEKMQPVIVTSTPLASFNYPSLICENQTVVNLTDNSTVPGGAATINNWWWDINSHQMVAQNPKTFIATIGGDLPVKLAVSSTEGCVSDTFSLILNIRYRPLARFNYSNPVCDNEVLRFTNLSSMPPGASPDYVSKWYWQFAASANSSQQHPSQLFAAGANHVKLIAESNYGCQSSELDSVLTIHAKPKVSLEINDSCVQRVIKYRAFDATNTVNKWYWDFGNGLTTASSSVNKTYSQEGYRPLTLMGQTNYGCKDTVTRPFTIYDNKALAGRDTIAAKDEPVQLNAHGGVPVKYLWSPASGLNNTTVENPVATWDKDQVYQLDALTDKGCDSHSRIVIKRYKGPELYIPNAFTPNGNGSNDLLKVFPVGMKAFKFLAIYNRYGQEIYKTTNYLLGWDGTYKGKQMDAGTYVAVSEAIDYKGKLMMEKTAVILIR